MKKIVLITSGQPSLNPRLVKEADSLFSAGYKVTVVYQYWNDWGTEMDEELLAGKKWKAICVGGSPNKQKIIYWITRSIHKTAILLAKNFGFKHGIAELAIGRCTWLLYNKAAKYPADIYIAHNLAALPAAIKAANKTKAKYGFDAEDFHRNEVSDNPDDFDVRIKSFIEEKCFPKADYITASSRQIALKYQQLFPSKRITTLLNTFPKNTIARMDSVKKDEALKLFWFSQSVGLTRGIQDVLYALKILEKENIEFHILGSLKPEVKIELDYIIKYLSFELKPHIFYHRPIHPDALAQFASHFDIGLALEPGFSINNNIALSNKLFTYISAGLALINSDTIAQSEFIENYPAIGKIYKKGNPVSLANVLLDYIQNPQLLKSTKDASYQAGQNYLNWETESRHFLEVIQNTLSS